MSDIRWADSTDDEDEDDDYVDDHLQPVINEPSISSVSQVRQNLNFLQTITCYNELV